jgi:putative peptidoglycan lipid II flippase
MVKGFRQIASLTFISRIFGMLRDMAYAAFLGADAISDAWFIAFKIPNLARRLFGEGAASASFIPVYSKVLQQDKESAKHLADTVVTVIFVLLSSIVLLAWTGIFLYKSISDTNQETGLILSLCAVMLPYTVMICTVAILAGVLNVHRHFAAPAAAPIVLNLFIISAVVLSGWAMDVSKEHQLFIIAAGVLLAGLIQLGMQGVALKSCGVSFRPRWDIHSPEFRKIILLMGPMIIGLTATQINTLADDLIAWIFSGSEQNADMLDFFGRQMNYPLQRGSVSHLYLAQRLYQLPLGVIGISLATAIFPVMSEDAARNDYKALTATIAKGIKGAVFVAVPATVGLFLVASPLVAVLFERGEFSSDDTAATAFTLIFYAIGVTGYFSQQILTRAFYSIHDSKTPTASAVIAVCINIILNLVLIWPLGTAGLALSTALCSYLQVTILFISLRKRFGKQISEGLPANIIKTVIGAAVMGLSGWGVLILMKSLPSGWKFDSLRVLLLMTICIVVYTFLSKILRNKMLSMIIGDKKR